MIFSCAGEACKLTRKGRIGSSNVQIVANEFAELLADRSVASDFVYHLKNELKEEKEVLKKVTGIVSKFLEKEQELFDKYSHLHNSCSVRTALENFIEDE